MVTNYRIIKTFSGYYPQKYCVKHRYLFGLICTYEWVQIGMDPQISVEHCEHLIRFIDELQKEVNQQKVETIVKYISIIS